MSSFWSLGVQRTLTQEKKIVSKLWECVTGFDIQRESVVVLTHDAASNNHSKTSLQATPGVIRILCAAHKASNDVKRTIKLDSHLANTLSKFKGMFQFYHQGQAQKNSISVNIPLLERPD